MTDDVPVMPGESPSDGFHVTTFDEARYPYGFDSARSIRREVTP